MREKEDGMTNLCFRRYKGIKNGAKKLMIQMSILKNSSSMKDGGMLLWQAIKTVNLKRAKAYLTS